MFGELRQLLAAQQLGPSGSRRAVHGICLDVLWPSRGLTRAWVASGEAASTCCVARIRQLGGKAGDRRVADPSGADSGGRDQDGSLWEHIQRAEPYIEVAMVLRHVAAGLLLYSVLVLSVGCMGGSQVEGGSELQSRVDHL